MLFQDVFIFNGTVMIICYFSGVDIAPQYIIDVCSRYGVDKYIARLPQGYHTVVGEEGINLSGGRENKLIALRASWLRILLCLYTLTSRLLLWIEI